MSKRRRNIFGYSQPLRTTISDRKLSTWWRHFCAAWGKSARLIRQSVQAARLLLRARHDGTLSLIVLVLQGQPFEVDEANRLWVYPEWI